MLSHVLVTIDCVDPRPMAEFWAAALHTGIARDTGDHIKLAAAPGASIAIGLQRVPEPAAGKNRLHLDLETDDLETEVDRLVGLGAAVLSQHAEPGFRWTVLADPEGNQFCVGQPEAQIERA
jgi:predicted enzyme related to lactoylglutathione lyase